MRFFTILLDDSLSISDYSLALKEYDTAPVTLELTTASYLYIGFEKLFSSVFVELSSKSLAGSTLSAEYFDGTTWQALSIFDETNGLSKSGFINFVAPEDMAANTIDAKEKIYIRLKTDIDTGAIGIKLIDIMFSSDLDLTKIRENIVSKFALNGTWIGKHIAARDHIIQVIRNKGNVKEVKKNEGLITEEILYKDIDKFDFLDPSQLRVAASYLALYFIFWYELSDEEGDKWQLKAAEMLKLYEDAINAFFVALDFNDDGKQDAKEEAKSDAIRTIVTG